MVSGRIIFVLSLGVGLVAGLPKPSKTTKGLPVLTQTPLCPVLCIDGITECGQGWGGCYDTCKPKESPVPPPCDSTKTKYPVVTEYVPGPSPEPSENCSTRSVCADYINECGIMYGGCFADCLPWPTFSPPPCPSGWSTGDWPWLPPSQPTPPPKPVQGDEE